ncbi:phosphate transporter [Coprinopsis cinerea okayama7|uniref:Phosphate transporter n=1 Tax=Coprinopsis cinerea (strain Okayama-7 / 130 / ATCC MYA-4618 / FGSC 9003) TaxID=240176 RepID=A8PF66_COPC7|nr:phosphate transporter [Coprinopsis cinerea okayama7\|eukprot:XP_001840941.2 phosphate transporter [Coprinopsis cinerea okayama7\
MASASLASKKGDDQQRQTHQRAQLEEVEHNDGRPSFVLNLTEVKLLGIAGVGFFLDAYDLFIINPVATMLQYRLYNGEHLPSGLEGFVKAGANIGSVIGQFAFGYAADALGRKKVYGKELMLIIFATIMTLTTPTGQLSPESCLIYLGVFRILLGIGVGGDYPMSASITSDRANLRKRGTMLTYIFSMQGWGSFVGSLATIIVLAIYRNTIEGEGKLSKVDGVWRIVVGISLIPAFATLYQRLTLPESTRYEESQRLQREHPDDEIAKLKELQKRAEESDLSVIPLDEKTNKTDAEKGSREGSSDESMTADRVEEVSDSLEPEQVAKKKAHFKDFYLHFRKWKNMKMLIGTSVTWFLLDIAFYGINLNQNVVLQQIGFDGSTGTPWNKMFKVSTGNMIITALGFVPGYYATVLTIETLGRKWIQIQGFLMSALFLAILAGLFEKLSKVQFIVCFAFLQFFFNFGANSTTYCYPAEVFPTRYRAFAHGISAASGKAGAIISALAFNTLSKKIGTPAVLWIFFGCCIVGAAFTLLLPEVKGRDPDLVLAEEIAEERRKRTN